MKKELFIANRLSVGIDEELLSGIPHVYEREIIGVIGPNGTGKSTLLRTVAGHIEPYSGSFRLGVTFAYLPQDGFHNWRNTTLRDHCERMGINVESVLVLLKTKFEYDCSPDVKLSELSGGQRSMALLACAFESKPGLLLLDEPTNHLDIFAKKVLIKLIREFKGSIVCVSHDTWFLKAITNTLWIIKDGTVRLFSGSYGEYQGELQRNEESRLRKVESVMKEQRKLEKAKAQEQKRVQRTARIARENKLEVSSIRSTATLKTWSQKAATRNKRQFDQKEIEIQEKLSELAVPKRKKVSGTIAGTDSRGSIVRIADATLSVFGRTLATHVKLDIRYGDRVALEGRNGTGKTALIRSVLGINGFILEPHPYVNPAMRIEYLDQHYQIVDPAKTVFENVSDFTGLPDERIRQHLSHFLFGDRQLVHRRAGELSGGMIARLAFVMLTIAPIDLLILDEPTNNLDIETIQEITNLLNEYLGALVVISHDVGFVSSLTVKKKLVLKK